MDGDEASGSDDDGIIAALTIILSDLSPDRQAYLLRSACPLLIVRTFNAPIRGAVENAYQACKSALYTNDGTSPMGIIAAQNSAESVREVLQSVRSIAVATGVSLPEK